ncbi:family 43 glycosylhydrolase [Paenibacillus sp. LHD-117]|uniref:family 43 glycosylhydrolase n=1 Tax=Paenibacillus sp. LHD-117 TaxID=3071412 RepID=UPI0027DEAE9E|nr:family 43 glycosylhydrolase [Paenibacillus sp. LHD-117]MDQ6417883.1 family 43 glycosylhydrolase [Paenibacillus sp. LHD-117]
MEDERGLKRGMLVRKFLVVPLLLCLAFTFLVIPTNAFTSDQGNGQFQNPILYMDNSDPSVIKVGSSYYMSSSSMHMMPGIMKSEDLVNWEIVSYAFSWK